MPRPSVLLNIVLLVVVVALFARLNKRSDSPPGGLVEFAVASDRMPVSAQTRDEAAYHGDTALVQATMERLQRIDARLAALEVGGRGVASQAPARLDPRLAAEADRRVAVVFSDRDVDPQDWMRWQATLSELPVAEQFALGAAFARAVNRDQLKLRF